MKLRILDNSIRLRLSQSEVAAFLENGKVEAQSRFGLLDGEVLIYSLEKIEAGGLSATYGDGHIKVFIPQKLGDDWASTDQVGMEGEQVLNENTTLRILIEKDFQCPTPRKGEDESDNFPNPNQPC